MLGVEGYMSARENQDAREVTAKIAEGYDLVPYNPNGTGSPGLDPSHLFGVAALYGEFPGRGDIDVLDLGCGGGGQILRAAAQTTGRLVGLDISGAACAEAAGRCAALGSRCKILHADLLDLDVASIGTFDLIYLVGVYYVVPAAVQKLLVDAIAVCLSPGGVLMISYYSSPIWRSIDALRLSIHGAIDLTAPPAERIRAARRHVESIVENGKSDISAQITTHALTCDEPTFFHEMLGPVLAPVSTVALEETLGAAGIHFLNWIFPGPFAQVATPLARAQGADRMAGGGYHYAVFAKNAGVGGADASWNNVQWQTRLRRAGASQFGLAVFADPASGQGLEVANSATGRVLDMLAAGPRPWPWVYEEMAKQPSGTAYATAVKRDFLTLWQQGVVTPLWAV